MSSQRNIDWSLYAIIDKDALAGRDPCEVAKAAIDGGAGVIQLRNKTPDVRGFYEDALAVREVTSNHGVPLIINDRVDVARAVDADGVHVGQEDLPVSVVRKLIGREKLIGASVHNLDEFEQTMPDRPDYLGVGTIFPTPSKDIRRISGPEIIGKIRARTELPIVGIGGITVANAGEVIGAGADGVAVISALLQAQDLRQRAREFMQKISAHRKQQEQYES